MDDAKSRLLVLESGYRVITTPNTPTENRAIEAATFHLPLPAGILITDRNRADLDWKNGSFTWRYRNKLILERTLSIRSYHLVPYVAAEPFYDQYKKWSKTDLYAGSLFPVGKHFQFNPYFQFENDTGRKTKPAAVLCRAGCLLLLFHGKQIAANETAATYASTQAFLKEGSGLVDEYQRLLSCLEKEESAPHGPRLLPNASLDV